ncbi:ABC transporter permease [Spirochaetota bacterium]
MFNKYNFMMALRNITRNKKRSALSVTAIFFAVMFVCFIQSYVTGIIGSMQRNVFEMEIGHVKIMHKGYLEEEKLMPLDLNIAGYENDYREVVDLVKKVDGVTHVLPRTKFYSMLNIKGKLKNLAGFALDPALEDPVISIKEKITDGRLFSDFNPSRVAQELVMGKALAYELGLKIGDKVTLMTKDAEEGLGLMDFRITGFVSFGVVDYDKRFFFIPLSTAAKFLKMPDEVMELTVFCEKESQAREIAEEINHKLDINDGNEYKAYPWQVQRDGFFYMGFTLFKYIYVLFDIVFLTLASLVIINTIMMVIFERMKEIGTLAAMGMRKGAIVQLFFYEAVVISVIGSFIGTLAGGVIAYTFSVVGIDFAKLTGGSFKMGISDVIYTGFSPGLLLFSFLFGILIASLCSFIPSTKAAKLDPVKALREMI